MFNQIKKKNGEFHLIAFLINFFDSSILKLNLSQDKKKRQRIQEKLIPLCLRTDVEPKKTLSRRLRASMAFVPCRQSF